MLPPFSHTHTHIWNLMYHSRVILCIMSDEFEAGRLPIFQELLQYFEKGEDFLKKINTGNETQVHQVCSYDTENKRQSMKYDHKESPQVKNFKIHVSTEKIMLTASWNFRRIKKTMVQNETLL